jgi:amino acid adenylation domain-containing protein
LRFLGERPEDDRTLSYGQLDRRARAIGARLFAMGAAGERVLLLHPPGEEYVAALFGCLYAGAVAVPAYPPRFNRPMLRLRTVVADCHARFALTTAGPLERVEQQLDREPALAALEWLATDQIADAEGDAWSEPTARPDSLALLQYTSGSVSDPKGVMLTQGHFLRNIQAMVERAACGPEDRWVTWLPPYHDMGLVGAIMSPLCTGSEVIFLTPGEFLQRPYRWLWAISHHRGTISGGPNFAYELCVRRISEEQRATLDLSCWRFAFSGAERVRADTIDRFCQTFGAVGFRRQTIAPAYGLAEATLGVSFDGTGAPAVVSSYDDAALGQGRVAPTRPGARARTLVACGQPLPDTQVAIVDPRTRRRQPAGGVGEIWVRSPSVALGYWGQPALSQEVFHARVAGEGDDEYLRTGDLGFLDGGKLFVVGRLKDLIILRGTNHYPEDLEATVERSQPGFSPSGCAAFSLDDGGEERLVIVLEVEARRPDVDQIAASVRAAVAEHHELAVHEVVLVSRMSVPRTSSGKVQRGLCRQMLLDGTLQPLARVAEPGTGPSEAPAALVATIAGIMADLLGVPTVLPDDDFFWLGGHSLVATQLASRLAEALQAEVPLRAIFEAPTPRALAARLHAAAPRAPTAKIAPLDRGRPLPLSFSQERMWFMHQLDPRGSAYNVAGALTLEGKLDRAALERTLAELLRRHEVLRTNYLVVDGEPRARVEPDRAAVVAYEDFSGRPDAEATATAAASALAGAPFDVGADLLVRAGLYRVGEDRHVLAVSMHHLVTDAWSMGLLLADFWRLYEAFARGRPVPPHEAAVSYIDYAGWQRAELTGERLQDQLAYWKRTLAGAEPLLLPTDRPRSRRRSSQGGLEQFPLEPELMRAVRDLGKTRGATPFMVTLAAFLACLHRHTGQSDLVLGIPVANRHRLASEGFAGTLVNTLAVRVRFDPQQSFSELLLRVREAAIEAYSHQDLPFERLVAELPVERAPGTSPLIQAMFDFQNAPMKAGGAAGLEGRPLPISRGASQFDLSLLMLDTELGQTAALEYSTELFDGPTVRRLAQHYLSVLEAVVVDPEQPVARLPILTRAEERELLAIAHERCQGRVAPSLLERFAAHVESRPHATAVADGSGALSYRALDRRSSARAAELRARGVGPGGRVAVYLDRSRELPITLLAIFKTGAAYVPLDPRHPPARVRYVLEDAAPTLVVTEESLRPSLPADLPVHLVREEPPPAEPLPPPPRDRAAYVIYTSGSTGQPKGVEIPMPALDNFLFSMSHTPGIEARDRLLSLTTIAFDIAGLELFLPLYNGASVHVAPAEVPADGQRLAHLLDLVSPTIVQATPATWRMLIEAGWKGDRKLKILCGGEAMPVELAEQLLARAASVWNVYGPTETTIWSTVHRVSPGEDPVSIGRAIDETSVYVRDQHGHLCPFGIPGELCIGGAGLATGYFQRPELTGEKFIPDPFMPGGRIYRTGDLAVLRADGLLEHRGRLDHQIKIRGFRIEPGEIEAVLKQAPGIREALVMTREDRPGDVRLVGYYVGAEATRPTDLRHHLGQRLPDYMVPSALVALTTFPLTPNGKIDRARLPRPAAGDAPVRAEYLAPRDALEERLAVFWGEALGLERPGVRDDFFASGGHSLLAVRMFSRIQRDLKVDLPLAVLFEAPTIERLAERIRGRALAVTAARAALPALEHVVLIRDGGPRPPLFCIHGAGGQVVTFAGLGQHLGRDRPFYGVQARGVDGRQQPLTRIEEMAAAYLAEIRTVQPKGPYHLVGYCGGGTVAFEMATMLRRAGEEVGLVVLMDTYHPEVDVTPARVRQMRAGLSAHGLRYLWHRGIGRLRREWEGLAREWRIGYHQLRGDEIPLELREHWLNRAFIRAEHQYRPRPYPGRLRLLRATDISPLVAGVGPDLGWAGLAADIEVFDVPGTHHTLVTEPNVQVVAAVLEECLLADD